MTPSPTPPVGPPEGQLIQVLKLVLGAVTSLACLAAFAFEKKLGADFGDVGRYALLAGIVGPGAVAVHGAYKTAPGASVVLLCVALGFGLTGCAHVDAVVVTKDTIHATRLAAVATEAGMRSADQQHLLTADQVRKWNAFLAYFERGFVAAADVWESAADAHDEPSARQAEAILARLMTQLAAFTAPTATTDGGVP